MSRNEMFTKYGPQTHAVLDALLAKYADEGVLNLDDTNVLRIPPFSSLGTPVQIIRVFGGKDGFEQAVHELQSALYQETA
jgi:type I restriction enzyme R subunit